MEATQKETHWIPRLAQIPTTMGPGIWAIVFTKFTHPNTAVRSLLGTSAAKKTCFGATSIS